MRQDGVLTDRVAIVTGAGRGIGKSIALALAAHGAAVALVARTKAELESVRNQIEAGGGRGLVLRADVSIEGDVASAVKTTVAALGRLDILVNNAGTGVFGPLVETTTNTWDHVMNVNARGTFLFCREAVPYLRQQDRATIVNIVSVVGHKGYPNQAVYSASKHAVMGMTKALAKEVQMDGIRVHAICPGGVDTNLIRDARPDLDVSVLMQPEEIADIVLFLVTRNGNAVIDEIRVRRSASLPWA
ncbi:MAG: SDR family oxidoreductase [Anaerolineae bacterium]|nr:SDR family oxidoreductase [Anaerolineae bacterium]